jgi:hypothetical protein
MALMRASIRLCLLAALVLAFVTLSTSAHAAEKLKTFYSGSGGISSEVHRVVVIEFATDGTAILQQKWHGKDAETWHGHWKRDGKNVTLTYDAAHGEGPATASSDKPLPEALVFTFKHGTLTATSWDGTTLGPLGPPKLTPFGGKVPQVTSVASCQALNTTDPTQNCVTWDSRR